MCNHWSIGGDFIGRNDQMTGRRGVRGRVWRPLGCGEVSHAVAVERIKVELTPLRLTGFKFQKQFDDAQLREAGFGSRMPFAKCVQVICGALKRDESMATTVAENESGGFDLDISVTVGYFSAEYRLSLDKVAIGRSDKLLAELRDTKQQLAAARIELEQTATALSNSIAESDTFRQQSAAASQRIAELSSHLDKENVETELCIPEMKYEMHTEIMSMKSTGSGLVVEVTPKHLVPQMIRASVKKHRAHYSRSYHPCNLLKDDDSDYASQMNADFGTDETDWVLFDCEAVYRRLTQITIRQRGAGSDVSKLKVQVTEDLTHDSWFTARPSTVRPTNTEEIQTFELNGVDANFRYIRVVFEENYGCNKPRTRRFVVNLLRFRGISA